MESGAEDRAPVRIFLAYIAYAEGKISLLSNLSYLGKSKKSEQSPLWQKWRYISMYGYGLTEQDQDLISNFLSNLDSMEHLIASKEIKVGL